MLNIPPEGNMFLESFSKDVQSRVLICLKMISSWSTPGCCLEICQGDAPQPLVGEGLQQQPSGLKVPLPEAPLRHVDDEDGAVGGGPRHVRGDEGRVGNMGVVGVGV